MLPYFWQTTWFRVLGGLATVLAAGGAVWFDTRRRMRRQLERAERQRDIERERSRIARDIHDDLGAQLTRITMLSESARDEMAIPDRTAAGLEKIYDTARELTRSMDEIVWAVNPRHDTLDSMATYLEQFAQDLLADRQHPLPPRFAAAVPGRAIDCRDAAQSFSRVQGGVEQYHQALRRDGGAHPFYANTAGNLPGCGRQRTWLRGHIRTESRSRATRKCRDAAMACSTCGGALLPWAAVVKLTVRPGRARR